MIELLNIDKVDLVQKSKSIMKEIINRNKYVTFYYLYKINNDIVNYKLEHENSILHNLSNQSKDILKLILSLNNELGKNVNIHDQNILMTNIDKNIDIIMILMQYVNLLHKDNNDNNILHYIVKNNRIDVMKYMLNNKLYKDLVINCLDQQNKNGETPILISTTNANESLFYILYNIGSNTDLKDIYDNSIYHYICKNKMCIGMEIKNQHNIFGFGAKDYATISTDYWKWI